MMVTIRQAEKDDYFSIFKLIKNELGYENLNQEKLYERLEKMQSDEDHYTVIAETNKQVVGFMGFFTGIAYNYDGEYIQIIALAVLKEFQGRGIGSELLKWLEEFAINKNINSFGVNSGLQRIDTHKFYEKNNYTKRSYSFSKDI